MVQACGAFSQTMTPYTVMLSEAKHLASKCLGDPSLRRLAQGDAFVVISSGAKGLRVQVRGRCFAPQTPLLMT